MLGWGVSANGAGHGCWGTTRTRFRSELRNVTCPSLFSVVQVTYGARQLKYSEAKRLVKQDLTDVPCKRPPAGFGGRRYQTEYGHHLAVRTCPRRERRYRWCEINGGDERGRVLQRQGSNERRGTRLLVEREGREERRGRNRKVSPDVQLAPLKLGLVLSGCVVGCSQLSKASELLPVHRARLHTRIFVDK